MAYNRLELLLKLKELTRLSPAERGLSHPNGCPDTAAEGAVCGVSKVIMTITDKIIICEPLTIEPILPCGANN